MERAFAARLLGSRVQGPARAVAAVIRVGTGALFVGFSAGKFVDHAKEAADFSHYGIPIPNVSTYVVGTLELVSGVLLVAGLLTRPAALGLAVDMIGAIATAGRVDGGSFHLGVAPTLLVAMLFLLWAGPGSWSVDAQLLRRSALSASPTRQIRA